MKPNHFYATGRRKTAVARVWVTPGTGKIEINGKSIISYFKRDVLRMLIEDPLKATDMMGKIDIVATSNGGGKSGQAGAFRLGIARALTVMNEDLRSTLRRADLMTRDPREKERKKYGKPGARKSFQFSKR
jgi:small subunit ribosomal protein S9